MKKAFETQLISIDKIRILNPRLRDKRKYMEIVNSIAKLGNKVPIKVSPRIDEEDDKEYDLVYGQGRLEAFKYLGETEIPAIVIPIPRLECLLMSVGENCARRIPRSIELVEWIRNLKEKGYSNSQIAQKINVSESYVTVIMRLLNAKEVRLINDVIKGRIPVNLATLIAKDNDKDVQLAMIELREQGKLNGRDLIRAQKAYAKYRAMGKNTHIGPTNEEKPSSLALLKALNKASARKKFIKKRTQKYEMFLIYLEQSLKKINQDKKFIKLLQDEKLDTIPAYLITGGRKNAQVCQTSI